MFSVAYEGLATSHNVTSQASVSDHPQKQPQRRKPGTRERCANVRVTGPEWV
jgi:hypothetical protein